MRTCSDGQEGKSLRDCWWFFGRKWTKLYGFDLSAEYINLCPFPWNSQTVDSRTQKLQFRNHTIYLFAQINLRRPNYMGRTATSGITYRSNEAHNQRVWTRFRPSFVFPFFFLPVPLTLRLLISYIYGAPSKARNANVVYIYGPTFGNAETV